MDIPLPSGTTWHVRDAGKKLSLRAQLPGARLYDLAARSLRAARASGVRELDLFTLALPASWLVNSPAVSRVLRRWALAPHRETCLALIELLESEPVDVWSDAATRAAMAMSITSLGGEPTVTEALSKVLALLVPRAVPLMPGAARAFVLGSGATEGADAFGRMVEWFGRAVVEHEGELERIAREHSEVELVAAGVLDRLLWFDSEGHAHFPKIA